MIDVALMKVNDVGRNYHSYNSLNLLAAISGVISRCASANIS
jgi:hypothetical protein